MPLLVDPRRDRKLNRLVKGAEIRRLRVREDLYAAGDPSTDVVLVRSGFLRLVEPTNGPSGERTVGVAGPWEVVGEEGLVGGERRYRCVAGEASTYQVFPGSAVFSVLKTTQRTFEAWLEGWAGDLALARHLATGSPGPSVRARLAFVLLDLSRRWGKRGPGGVLVPHRVTHQVLADLAGAHRSTVTTTLNDWLYRGLLAEAERGLRLARPDELERLAGEYRDGRPASTPGLVDPLRAQR